MTTSAAGGARTMSRGGREVVTSGRSREVGAATEKHLVVPRSSGLGARVGRGVQLPATTESGQLRDVSTIDGVAARHGAHSPATK